MAGMTERIKAPNKTELRKKAQEWINTARTSGFDIVLAYDLKRVKKTDEGYSIIIKAHS